MNYSEKVEHIKHELGFYLETENDDEISNSVFKADASSKDTYEEIRALVAKCEGYKALFKDQPIHPSPVLGQMNQFFAGMAPMQMQM